ncbi:hypothetical protein F2Q69_00019496 [Brassica cretica]|uniref:FBD domain-containing protein n=1 Tax=Brassica cretica TaxID=69181 RepID=A0A8S9QAY9_BRACR|nr:hypothetical protein F2Q69_00019496 [Brassica cretica]
MLVTLNLTSVTLTDASTLPSFSTLKTLRLLSVKYPGDEFVRRLLSSCHVLEDLEVEQCNDDNVTIFTVKVLSLRTASLYKSSDRCTEDEDGFVIYAPSLELLELYDYSGSFCIVEKDMPNIVDADVFVNHYPSTEILSSITSVKRLDLCLSYSKDAYSDGSVFHRLVHLKICTCATEWLNLLMCVLRDSPKLRAIKLRQCHDIRDEQPRPCWNEPKSVPECLISSLETLKWVKYEGTEEQKEVAAFIIRNGRCLKKVAISSETTDSDKKLEMLKETAVKRGLRELSFDYWPHNTINEPSKLPQSLFTCGTLVVLKLTDVSLVDVTFPVCFQLLKTLQLSCVIYLGDETPQKLLSSCKILQELDVNRVKNDNVTVFSIKVPSLQKLIFDGKWGTHDGISEFVMNAPSLKFLEINDCSNECMVEKMPELVAANPEAIYWNTDNILSSFTSVKRLSLCLAEESPFPTGEIFHQLVDLEFCTCETEWDLLMYFLKHSPKLRALKLNEIIGMSQSSIPESLMFSLETLEWTTYRGWQVEKELATFLLKYSRRLKTATISPQPTSLENKHRMLTELALLSRGSTTCQLVFG